MMHSYQTKEFGKRLKSIRTGLNLTQQTVSEITGINIDTLRKIEQGYVIPRYDTLEILSIAYKCDLLDVFKNYRGSADLYEIYSLLDKCIVDYNPEGMEAVRKKAADLDEKIYSEIILASEIESLKLLIDAVCMLNSSGGKFETEHMLAAKENLIASLKKHTPEFEMEKLESCRYSYFDIRILIVLSVIIMRTENSSQSNRILFFLLKITDKSANASLNEKLLVLKIYCNIAYNYYLDDKAEKTIEYAEEGIAFALDNHLMYGLPLLYMRKGIAQMILNIEGYEDSLKKSIYTLDIQGNYKLKQIYLKVLKDKYNIENI